MSKTRVTSLKGNSTLVEKDHGFDALMKRAAGMSRLKVSVGVQGADAERKPDEYGGLTIAEIAAVHEFGAPKANIPERAPLRSTYEINKRTYVEALKIAGERVLIKPGARLEAELFRVGEVYRRDVIERIKRKEIVPDILQATKDRKGSDTPLVDNGIYVGSISVVVKKGGS